MDEDVIRRKLLIDGDGTGDDRRLNVLLKSFLKWGSSDCQEECLLTHDRMLAQLAQCEFAVTKSRLSAVMSSSEAQNYENLSDEIKTQIEEAKTEIETLKVEFRKAKTIRKNRMEYDILAKVIGEQPDRKETQKKLSQLSEHFEAVEETGKKLATRLELRKKQFESLWTSVHAIQTTIDDIESEEMMDVSLDTFDDDEVTDNIEETEGNLEGKDI